MSSAASARTRRAGGLAVLTLGAFSLGGPATALAAPDDEAPDPAGTSRPEAGPAAAAEVLTPSPEPGSTDADPEGARFGWGKLEPDVVFAGGSSFPEGAVLDRTGAQIRVTYTEEFGDPISGGPVVLECT